MGITPETFCWLQQKEITVMLNRNKPPQYIRAAFMSQLPFGLRKLRERNKKIIEKENEKPKKEKECPPTKTTVPSKRLRQGQHLLTHFSCGRADFALQDERHSSILLKA